MLFHARKSSSDKLMVVAGQQEYATQQPKDHSLVHNLLAARRKDTGQIMTNGEICAQSFTFILAGECVLHCPCCILQVRVSQCGQNVKNGEPHCVAVYMSVLG